MLFRLSSLGWFSKRDVCAEREKKKFQGIWEKKQWRWERICLVTNLSQHGNVKQHGWSRKLQACSHNHFQAIYSFVMDLLRNANTYVPSCLSIAFIVELCKTYYTSFNVHLCFAAVGRICCLSLHSSSLTHCQVSYYHSCCPPYGR